MHLLTNGIISPVSFRFCGLPNHESLSQAVTELHHSDPHQERTCHTVGGAPTASRIPTRASQSHTLDTSVGAHMPAWTRETQSSWVGACWPEGPRPRLRPVPRLRSQVSQQPAGLRAFASSRPRLQPPQHFSLSPPGLVTLTCHLDTRSLHNPH